MYTVDKKMIFLRIYKENTKMWPQRKKIQKKKRMISQHNSSIIHRFTYSITLEIGNPRTLTYY